MRHVLLVGALAVGLLALGPGPAAAQFDASPFGWTSGGGEDARGVKFAFSAHRHPETLEPLGHVHVDFGPFVGGAVVSGPVTCLRTIPGVPPVGDRAVIGFEIEHSTNEVRAPVGSWTHVGVTDTGEPEESSNSVPPDRFQISGIRQLPIRACERFLFVPQSQPVVSGNILVEPGL